METNTFGTEAKIEVKRFIAGQSTGIGIKESNLDLEDNSTDEFFDVSISGKLVFDDGKEIALAIKPRRRKRFKPSSELTDSVNIVDVSVVHNSTDKDDIFSIQLKF
jgi:hypothetical protein